MYERPGCHRENVPISKILFREKVNPEYSGRTDGLPVLQKNTHGEYKVIDGNHRLYGRYSFLRMSKDPHDIVVECFVEDEVVDRPFHGEYVWQSPSFSLSELRPHWLLRAFYAIGGIGESRLFPCVPRAMLKQLSRKTRRLLARTEGLFSLLYSDAKRRHYTWLSLLKKEKYLHRLDKEGEFYRQFSELQKYAEALELLIERDEQREKEEVALLRNLAAALRRELARPAANVLEGHIKQALATIEGNEDNLQGLLRTLRYQLDIIKSGKPPDNLAELERVVQEELLFREALSVKERM